MGDSAIVGEMPEQIARDWLPEPGVGAPPSTAVDEITPVSLFDLSKSEGNPADDVVPEVAESPALFVTLAFYTPAGLRRVMVPWCAGKRLQFYLRDVNLIQMRLHSRLGNGRGQKIRMSYVPVPGEQILMVPPNAPLR